MRTVALVVAVAACGGAAPEPQTIRRSEPDKAAIAPPPPIPDVRVEERGETDTGDSKRDPLAPPPSGLAFADVVGAPANAPLKGSVLVWADATFYLATESVKPLRMCAPVRAVKHEKPKPGMGFGGTGYGRKK